MAVGADHRGRACVAVWRDAGPSSPLTALRHQPDHGWRSCWTRPTAWRRGRWVQAQQAQPTTQRCPARRARVPAGVGASGARPPGAVRCWKGGVVRLRAATPRSVLAWRSAAAKPQPVAHRSDQPRLGLSSCEGSCSRPGPTGLGPHRCHAASAASGPPPAPPACFGWAGGLYHLLPTVQSSGVTP
jgi:hypothetical protein